MKKYNTVEVARLAKGLTYEALANKTGVPRATLYSIAKQTTEEPSLSVAQRLSQALGVPTDLLFPDFDASKFKVS